MAMTTPDAPVHAAVRNAAAADPALDDVVMIAGQPHAIHMTMMVTLTAILLATLGIGRAQETPAGAHP